MPAKPKAQGESLTPRVSTPSRVRPTAVAKIEDVPTAKKPSAKRPSSSKRASKGGADESGSTTHAGDEREPERVHVFLKISPNTARSVSSCVACDTEANTAWSLDFDGHRSGVTVPFDGVFSADQPEQVLHQAVVNRLADDFVSAAQGVACLMCYGQAQAGKETLMYGEAGSRVNFTPRGLPAPGVRPADRPEGLVQHAFRSVLSQLPMLQATGAPTTVEMACVMLHMELIKDLLSPQSRARLTESDAGVQLEGVLWQKISDVKEAEGLLQLANQNKAVHTLQADNGFLDACHIIIAIRMPTGALASSGAPQHRLFYLVELAAPPLPRPSGVAGLNVEDFCALNTSLRCLIASLGAMARKGASRPPLRDSKLTRVLSGALGANCIRTHLLLCVSQQREHAETTAELLHFGTLARSAKLWSNVYEATAPKALCLQLQAELTTIEAPNDEMYDEMIEQMRPQESQLEKLAAAARGLQAKHQRALDDMAVARGNFENKLQQLSLDSDAMQSEIGALSEQNDLLRGQARSVRLGEGIEDALEALRESDARELSALNKQVNALQERLNSAKQEQARLSETSGGKSTIPLSDTAKGLVALGRSHMDKGNLAEASPVLNSALTAAEIAHGPMHKAVVPALTAMADLCILQKREEQAIALLKRAYTVDKEALGPDAPEVGQHLIALGTAYHAQGKLEAASLTLEEARSILVYALGAEHEQTLLVKEKIKKLSVIEVDMGGGQETHRPAQFVSRMQARLEQQQAKIEALNLEEINKKQSAADLRRNGLLSARGTKAGDHFNYASHVAERVTSEQEKRAAGERRELLQKKKQLFRERLKKRGTGGALEEEENSDMDEPPEDTPEALAAVESEMMQVLGRSTSAAQTENWAVVVDCATQMEGLMQSCHNKSKGSAAALRVLRSGMKRVGSDESRASSVLAILMMMEWCVPVCDSSFRQALAGERWIRRLVELARRDSSERMLVRATVTQLLVNWKFWYGSGFEEGVNMLQREGYTLPEPLRLQDGTETPRGPIMGSESAQPVLLGPASLTSQSAENEQSIKAEMTVMREDLELLRRALQARKAGTLGSIELAEAQQASNDCSGWLARLAQLLGTSVGGGNTARTARKGNGDPIAGFSEETKHALRTLQQEMAEIHRTFQAAYPGRKGISEGTRRATARQAGDGALLQLGQTPRTRALFMSDGGHSSARGGTSTLSEFFGVGGSPTTPGSRMGETGGHSTDRRLELEESTQMTEMGASMGSALGGAPPFVPKLQFGGAPATPSKVPPLMTPGPAQPPAIKGLKLNLGAASNTALPSDRDGAAPVSNRPPPLNLNLKEDYPMHLQASYPPSDEPSDSAQLLMQEVAILQMQAEGWKAEWSIAMQENERLRMALYDAESALDALPGGDALAAAPSSASESELQWRGLCTSIARAADEEKAWLLEELNNVRMEFDSQLMKQNAEQTAMQRAEIEASKAQGNAEHWKSQLDREEREHARLVQALMNVEAKTAEAQSTARGNEQGGAAVLVRWREASRRRNEEENKLQAKKREAEARLTAVYNSHRQQLERLQFAIKSKKSEQAEIAQQLTRWRTQWEEEMAEKNAVATELLTLRCEFEKSSATYDKEIEGLKDLLERLRFSTGETREKWDATVTQKNILLGQLDEAQRELERLQHGQSAEERTAASELMRLREAQQAADKWAEQAEVVAQQEKAAAERLAKLRSEHAGATQGGAASELHKAVGEAKLQIALGEEATSSLADLETAIKRLEEDRDALAEFAAAQRDTSKSTIAALQEELQSMRQKAEATKSKAEAEREEKSILSDQMAGLKAEVEELTVSHDLEVERLQERFGQLQTVRDKLELQLSEQRKEHEKALLDLDSMEEQKNAQLKEAHESAMFNLKESQTMLRDAKATLKKETKAKNDALDSTRETKTELEDVLKEARQKEAELHAKVTEEGTIKERLEASLSSDRVQSEQAVATLRAQLNEAKASLKEAETKATDFAKEYGKEFYLRKQIAEQLQEMTGGLRVFCRVRPPLEDEVNAQVAVKVLDDTTVLLEDPSDNKRPRRRFEFNQVYGPKAEQAKVFEDVHPMISQTLEGFNVCALFYGAAGSGKTYTMVGTTAEPGLLHRCVNAIFEEITNVDESMHYEVFLSMLEVVDETIRDLQLPSNAEPPPYRIVRDPTYGMQVERLTSTSVHTASHARSLLAQAQEARSKGEISSGSHLIVTLTVRSSNSENGLSSVGKLTLVDLVSSELSVRAEDRPCNTSLTALHSVVESLSKSGKKAKFNESILTDLLQDSLGGNSKTMMFVTVAPTLTKASLSGETLSFGNKARSISLGPASKNKESMQTAMHKVNTTMTALTEHAGSKKKH
ncbi:hypothetical protein AB1Y20_000718 [Prymnesium parvum]|uniref:Kinesin motor domain-containing protein n=1 Tax=Prymnesium parvum TaxID=97485 RepID=A0AB34K5L5_PRYPA